MIYLVLFEGKVWAGYESERDAIEAAADIGGTVEPVHYVRKQP